MSKNISKESGSKKQSDLPSVSKEFLRDNQTRDKTISKSRKKNGGPYSKADRQNRRDEVHRLHFEYGYSANKIADLMKVNRNTINGDVDYWYSKIQKNTNIYNPENAIILNLERFEVQRTRLREQLDKVKNIQEQITLERLICDIDSKIIQTSQKLAESTYRVHKLATDWLNNYMKKNKKSQRYFTLYDTVSVSDKAHERINRIINEDKNKRKHN